MTRARRTTKQTKGHRALSKKGKPPTRALGVWTPGEELWVRRRMAGLTGPEAAASLGIGRTALWEAEARGKGALYVVGLARRLWPRPPGLPELLALARRRQGWGLKGTAERCAYSHTTLLKSEREGLPWLVRWWEARGFTFVRPRG